MIRAPTPKEFNINSLIELDHAVGELLPNLNSRALVLIEGPLGVGKTKTVEVFLRQMGFEGSSSPTFALHQSYSVGQLEVDHFDLYRIDDEESLMSAGLWDALEKENGLVFVEWAERLRSKTSGGLCQTRFVAPGWQVLTLKLYWQGSDRKLIAGLRDD